MINKIKTFFKRNEFTIKDLRDTGAIKECLIDIDYHLDFLEKTTKGFHIQELRKGYNDLTKELKN